MKLLVFILVLTWWLVPAVAGAASPSPSAGPVAGRLPGPGEVWLSEVMANPAGTDTGQEWLELANRTDDPLDLSNLTVVRASGSVLVRVPASTVLAEDGYLVLDDVDSSVINGGDTLAVIAADGQELDRISYDGEGEEGWSWSRIEAELGAWSELPTPGAANVFPPEPQPAPDPTTTAVSAGTASAAKPKAAAKASTKKSSAKKAAAKSASTKLPAGGPGAPWYLVSVPLAGLYYWMVWRKRRKS